MTGFSTRAVPSDNSARGIGFTLLAIAVFATQDAAAKVLVETYSPFQITMMRYWAFAAVSLVWVLRQAPLRHAFRSGVPMLQVLRAVLLVADIWLFALAIRTVPLAELQSIMLIYPLLVTLVAIPILGETVGIFRFSAVAAGFLGALIIVRPGGVALTWDVWFAVASAAAYALYIALTRKVSRTDSTSTSMVYVGVIGLVMTSAVGVFFWQPMDGSGLLLVGYVMLTSCVAHALMMTALAIAPASVLQPFSYTALIWAIALSALLFHHVIDPLSLVGALVVVAAGLVVMARERLRKVPSAGATGLPGKE